MPGAGRPIRQAQPMGATGEYMEFHRNTGTSKRSRVGEAVTERYDVVVGSVPKESGRSGGVDAQFR